MSDLTFLVILLVVFIPMLIEAARARGNERTQRARGGVEPRGDVYALMQVAYPGLFLAMIAEGALRGAPPRGVLLAGASMFATAKLLKWWAIRSLGSSWTFRIIVVPGASLVASGPYRYLRHPNYLAVAGEFVGAALMTGAAIAGPIATLVFGALMLKRIAVENRALKYSRSPTPELKLGPTTEGDEAGSVRLSVERQRIVGPSANGSWARAPTDRGPERQRIVGPSANGS